MSILGFTVSLVLGALFLLWLAASLDAGVHYRNFWHPTKQVVARLKPKPKPLPDFEVRMKDQTWVPLLFMKPVNDTYEVTFRVGPISTQTALVTNPTIRRRVDPEPPMSYAAISSYIEEKRRKKEQKALPAPDEWQVGDQLCCTGDLKTLTKDNIYNLRTVLKEDAVSVRNDRGFLGKYKKTHFTNLTR